jgi:hypothetical protein
MAEPTQAVRKMPAFPGVAAARNPQQLPPGARQMTGVPVATMQPATQAGGKSDVRVTDNGSK